MSRSETVANPPQVSTPSAQDRLSVFAGRWKMAGQAHESPFGPRADVSAVETYAWLPGARFLIHRLEGRLGPNEIACIEIIGQDSLSDGYRVHSFYNNGTRNEWQLDESNDTWTQRGVWALRDRTLQVRCTARFETRNLVTCSWEYSRDGEEWLPFWDTRLRRA